MKHLGRLLVFLMTILCFGQESVYVQEWKQPGDAIRVQVTLPRSIAITSGIAVFQREGHAGECHVPQAIQLKSEIVCSQVDKINTTTYSYSGVVENNITGVYKLMKIVAQSGDQRHEYVWGRDFHDIVRVLIRNPQEKMCVGPQE